MSYQPNKNARYLAEMLTYWMTMSTQQAIYFLRRFHHVANAEVVVKGLIQNRYFCYYRNDPDVISCSGNLRITHSKGKEKCLWVFFRYLEMYFFKNMNLQILTMNGMQGVDFVLIDEEKGTGQCYSLVYVTPDDLSYRSFLSKTNHDLSVKYLLVTDRTPSASKVERINSDDRIWYVSDITNEIGIYKGE